MVRLPRESQLKVVIIGSGPAGIAASAALNQRGIDNLVLEAEAEPSAALRGVSSWVRLLTPRRLTQLEGMDLRDATSEYLPVREFVSHLDAYRHHNGVRVRTNARVVGVRGSAGRFELTLRDGSLVRAECVVDASGMISTPRYPGAFAPAGTNIPYRHSVHVELDELARAQRLLIVGGGTSGLEIVEQWLRVRGAGKEAWLAHRGPLWAVPHRPFGVDIHHFLSLPEQVPATHPWVRHLLDREAAIGWSALPGLLLRRVRVVAAAAEFARAHVRLANGCILRPDFIVFATGFEHRATHLDDLVSRDSAGRPLCRHCQSVATPGLFVLGSKFAHNAASAFLRGIAVDAVHVAAQIGAR